jgi:acyl carrier protein phosphodiesterase
MPPRFATSSCSRNCAARNEALNHLGHFLLAPPDDAARAGTLIADFARGSDLGMYAPGVAFGIRLHRRIDALVDTAAEVGALRALVAPPLRRYAGIVLDVMIDHALIRQWRRVHDDDRTAFAAGVYASLERGEAGMPESARRLSARMRQHDLLDSCATLAGCERTLDVIARRLSRPVALGNAVAMVASHLDRIDAAALALLARLRTECPAPATA